jgi:hypothetical protein
MTLKSQVLSQPPEEVGNQSFAWARWVSTQRILVLIILVSLGLRIASALLQGESVRPLPGVFDQVSYDGLARRVIDGYGFSFADAHWPATRAGEPTAHWSYLYTLYLAIIYSIVGVHPVAARLLQAALVGVLHSWLIWRITRRLFGATVGLVAAGVSACYIYFFYYAGSLITEPFYITAILWTFDVTFRLAGYDEPEPARQERRVHWPLLATWCELGLALGVTLLLRQLFILFIPVLYLWLWWRIGLFPRPESAVAKSLKANGARRRLPGWLGFLLATVIVGLLILPWTIRNYRAFGVWVPLNTNSGYAFYWGNHPIYGTHFIGILPEASYYKLLPPELLYLNEAQLDQALLKRGLGFVSADPQRYVLLSLSRIQEYFKFWPSGESTLVSNLARVGSFGLFLPFMVHGLYLSLRACWQARDPRQRAALILLYLFMVVYTGIHLLSWALIRYRLPVDAFALSFAAYSLVELTTRYQSGRPRPN